MLLRIFSNELFERDFFFKKMPKCEVICMPNFVFMLLLLLSVIYQGLTLVFFQGHYKEHCTFITAL